MEVLLLGNCPHFQMTTGQLVTRQLSIPHVWVTVLHMAYIHSPSPTIAQMLWCLDNCKVVKDFLPHHLITVTTSRLSCDIQ